MSDEEIFGCGALTLRARGDLLQPSLPGSGDRTTLDVDDAERLAIALLGWAASARGASPDDVADLHVIYAEWAERQAKAAAR
jgi:diadenosine tetraphosphatase ApaH/serine/threonine PP2A family protein phosphatase